MSKLFHISISNPFKTWWKARKYFKRPKWYFKFLLNRGSSYPYASPFYLGKILDINIHDVWWKDKWNTPRHERNPLIYICLFQKFVFTASPHIYYHNEFGEKEKGDMYYWEYVLDWLYYRKSLRNYPIWTSTSKLYKQRVQGNNEDGSEDTFEPYPYIVPIVSMSLNKEGISQLKKELNGGKNNIK